MCFILYVVEKKLVYAPYIEEDMSNLKGIKKKYNLLLIWKWISQYKLIYTSLLCFLSNNISG